MYVELTCVLQSKLTCCDKERDAACCGGRLDGPACPCKRTCEQEITKYSDMACKITGGVGLFISFTEVSYRLSSYVRQRALTLVPPHKCVFWYPPLDTANDSSTAPLKRLLAPSTKLGHIT